MLRHQDIEVIAGDCTAGGHYCYSYFDSQCGPMEILVNGLGKNNSCTSTATVSAPANLNSYQWNGPSGFTSSASSFTTTTAGVYSLTIPQNPPYQPIQKTLSLVISPASVTLAASKNTICAGETVSLSASGLSTYSWSNGSATPGTTVSPTSTKVYTLTGTNSDNCTGFAMITVSVNACTGIDKGSESKSEVNVFPNPNNGEFTLNILKTLTKGEILIVNNVGQVVHTQAVQKGENKIKTKGLPTGVYYYSVTDNSKSISKGKISIE